MTREELIKKAIDLGRSPEDAAKIADAWIAKQDESKGEKKSEAKPAPEATPKAAPPAKAPPKPAAAKTPEPPKPSPVVAAQVPKVGAKVYGAEPPSKYRDYADTTPPVSIRKPEPEVSLMGRGGLWLDREAAAKAQAEDRAREAARAPRPARDFMETGPAPALERPEIPESVRRYSSMGDIRAREDESAGMRAALKARFPAKVALIDSYDAADLESAYKRLTASPG